MLRTTARYLLIALLVAAGAAHLSWGRRGYRIAVPDWAVRLLRTNKDTIVLVSGAAELVLAAAIAAAPRPVTAVAVASFFVAVFPGNVHHWRTGRSVPMMRTDRSRFVRLLLQPVLVAWALWSVPSRWRR